MDFKSRGMGWTRGPNARVWSDLFWQSERHWTDSMWLYFNCPLTHLLLSACNC